VSGAQGFQFGTSGDNQKLLSVDQWGTSIWTTLRAAFLGATHMHMLATDAPNLSAVTDLSFMFNGATSFNESISHWDVSTINNMKGMFAEASSFNRPLDNWDTLNVTDMQAMFLAARSFNQAIGSWDTSKVLHMSWMFRSATSFDQNI
jgi:surface protein